MGSESARDLSDEGNLLRGLAESSPTISWIIEPAETEPGYSIIYVSEAYEKIWQRDRDSLAATPSDWITTVHEDDRERVSLDLLHSIRRQSDYDAVFRILAAGSCRWIRSRGTWSDAARHLTVHSEDITELKQSQQTLEASQEHLQRTNRIETLGRVAGGVAHNFNNLLQVILSCSEQLASSEVAPPEELQTAEKILGAAERGAKLTRQLMAFSREQSLEQRVFDLRTLVSEGTKMVEPLVGDRIRVSAALSEFPVPIEANSDQLIQVLVNLALNAREAMPLGGQLTVGLHLESKNDVESAVIRVSDTGIGIDELALPRIFDPFFTTKNRSEGTGLGLSSARGLIAENGGEITVESTSAQGTTFCIRLPVALQDRPDALQHETPQHESEAELQSKTTVMIVDDDPNVRQIMRTHIQDLGYLVVEARNAGHALEQARTQPRVDLLVTDLEMPGESGVELANKLQDRIPNLATLYVSGYRSDWELIREQTKTSITRFLEKPFPKRTFTDRVEELLREASERK